MQFRALLPNKDYSLLPGLFVQIRVAISDPAPQLTIPDTAVQYDQIGSYVLIVDQQNKVNLQRVVLGGLEKGRRAILQGIKPEEQIIVGGLQNATPGNLVAPQTEKIA